MNLDRNAPAVRVARGVLGVALFAVAVRFAAGQARGPMRLTGIAIAASLGVVALADAIDGVKAIPLLSRE